jgi:pectate lyase
MRSLAIACCLVACSAAGTPKQQDAAVVDDASAIDSPVDQPTFNLYADASGTVEVFVNGTSVGKTSAAGDVLSLMAPLPTGTNVIALRATKGSAAMPFAHAQIGGEFGTAGTTDRWKAKVATSVEATEASGAWATMAFDDTSWARARDVAIAPASPFPVDGPARGIWTTQPSDATVLLRLTLYVPANAAADKPLGFGSAVTGGAGGNVVTVTTPAELAAAVGDAAPLIIQVKGVLDFTGSDGPLTSEACYQRECPAPMQSQYRVNFNEFCQSVQHATFNITYDKAGRRPLMVGSNKTIIGLGPDAAIRGKGIRIEGGVSNVIVRNLTISDINPQVIWGGDALDIDDADRVWIDHVRVARVGRQMFVTGKGKATNVTLSWNEFDGRTTYSSHCNGSHYWLMLIVGAMNTITAYGNWIHDTSGRGPDSGGYDSTATLHFVNNYYDYVPGVAANPYTTRSKYLFEGTYFRNVDSPILPDTTTAPAPGLAYAPIASTVGSTTSACMAALGRPCAANIASPQNGSFPLNQAVLDTFAPLPASAKVTAYPADRVPLAVPHLAGPGHI